MIYEFNGYKPVIHPSSFVHKEATIIGNVLIGKDVYIGPGASLRGDWGKLRLKMVVMYRTIVSFIFSQVRMLFYKKILILEMVQLSMAQILEEIAW